MKPNQEKFDFDAFVAWTRARVLRTSGDIGRAEVAAQEARYAAEQGESAFVAFRSLLDTNMATPDIARASAALEAERAAHATAARLADELQAATENVRTVERVALIDVIQRWQRVTGCTSPEALSALASKGVDGLPSAEEIGAAYNGHHHDSSPERVLDLVRFRLAPIFAAKDAERDALRARVAELEARISANGGLQ